MTAKRDLKKRVRARQERTGESYTRAREHVLAARQPLDVLELVDLSAEAARLGLPCRAAMAPSLTTRVDGATVLARLRAALLASEGDPGTKLMRDVLLHGVPDVASLPVSSLAPDSLERVRAFMARARAGIAGASPSGRMLALHVDGSARGETVVLVLCAAPPAITAQRPPMLLVWSPESLLDWNDIGIWAGF
jgi:hypothetical protein